MAAPLAQLVHKEASKHGFTPITENNYSGFSKPKLDNLEPCECKMHGMRSCTASYCDHARHLVECNEKICSIGHQKCGNRISQKKHWLVSCAPFPVNDRGRGLKSLSAIPKASVIGRYLGVVSSSFNENSNYVMELMTLPDKTKLFVDAKFEGNNTRFINHSCEPNCRYESWRCGDEFMVYVVTIKNIAKNQELTVSYGSAFESFFLGDKCLCGSSKCTSTK